MKLPTLNLNFFKKQTKKRVSTNFGKRRSSNSSSTHRNRRSTSGRKPRKRSITYYAPSKSKFYPTEYFPSIQRIATQAAAIATTPVVSSRFSQKDEPQTVSIDTNDSKSNYYPSLRSHTSKQTYLCDQNDHHHDLVLHQPPAWYMQSKAKQQKQHSNDIFYQTNDLYEMNNNKQYSNAAIDTNGNVVLNERCHLNNGNGNNNNTYFQTKEFIQGVPSSQPMINTINSYNDTHLKHNITELQHETQYNLSPSSIINAYSNPISLNRVNSMKYLQSNTSNLYAISNAYQAPQLNQSFLSAYGSALTATKKLERHRRRKVSFTYFFR